MRIRIKEERCQGHGMCFMACPEVFELSDENGHAFLLMSDIGADLADKVERAIQSCPEGAIERIDNGDG